MVRGHCLSLIASAAPRLTRTTGNVLAGYLATKMGLPVDKLIGTTVLPPYGGSSTI